MEPGPEDTLAALGFTELETRVYVALLRQSPQTGYALARALGKAAANVYQTLSALARKGAVLLEEAGGSRSATAVPPRELLDRLERRFRDSRNAAEQALARVHVQAPGDRLYQVQDPEQFYARAEAVVERAQEVLYFDLFPEPLRRLEPVLRRAHARGLRLAGLVYAPVDLPFRTVMALRPQLALERWPGWQATLCADASEFLVGLLARDGRRLLHGLWSDSTYLACLQHNGLGAEIALGARRTDTAPGDRSDDISLLCSMPPGLRRLMGNPHEGEAK